MFADQIETLRRQFTDKYVVVDESRPELRRFRGATGLIKTVNMNGRALVQFDLYNDTGWHDIAIECLRVVDAPPPKVEDKKPERKAAAKTPGTSVAEKRLRRPRKLHLQPLPRRRRQNRPRPRQARSRSKKSSPRRAAKAAAARPPATGHATGGESKSAPATPPVAKPAATAKSSTADILAAARAAKGTASTTTPDLSAPASGTRETAKPAGGKMSTADILAAARAKKPAATPAEKPAKAAAPATPAPAKLSTADILAAARANKATAQPAVKPTKGPVSAAAAPATPSTSKPAPAKLSTADILAAAASKQSGGEAARETAGNRQRRPLRQPLPTQQAGTCQAEHRRYPRGGSGRKSRRIGRGSTNRDHCSQTADARSRACPEATCFPGAGLLTRSSSEACFRVPASRFSSVAEMIAHCRQTDGKKN